MFQKTLKKSLKNKKSAIRGEIRNDEKELKQEDEIEEQETVEQVDEASMLKNQISDLTEQVNQWKTDYYKVFADMENLKKRLKIEHENALKFMLQDFASDLLPIVDNLQRALGQEASEEIKAFLKGFDMITTQLLDVLKKHGVEEIEAVGKEFDPNFHQAVMMTNVEGVESNMITEELQKGYKLKDRVIRASLVKVNE